MRNTQSIGNTIGLDPKPPFIDRTAPINSQILVQHSIKHARRSVLSRYGGIKLDLIHDGTLAPSYKSIKATFSAAILSLNAGVIKILDDAMGTSGRNYLSVVISPKFH